MNLGVLESSRSGKGLIKSKVRRSAHKSSLFSRCKASECHIFFVVILQNSGNSLKTYFLVEVFLFSSQNLLIFVQFYLKKIEEEKNF